MGAKKSEWQDVVDLNDMPAGFEVFGGDRAFSQEHFRGRQVQGDVRGVFTIRHQPIEISTTWRIVHVNDSNKVYNIAAVVPVESQSAGGALREIDIFVKAIDP